MEAPVDLRSDTVTRPTAAMRLAIANVDVGDDVYGEDPTVKKLEETVAEIIGTDAGEGQFPGILRIHEGPSSRIQESVRRARGCALS